MPEEDKSLAEIEIPEDPNVTSLRAIKAASAEGIEQIYNIWKTCYWNTWNRPGTDPAIILTGLGKRAKRYFDIGAALVQILALEKPGLLSPEQYLPKKQPTFHADGSFAGWVE